MDTPWRFFRGLVCASVVLVCTLAQTSAPVAADKPLVVVTLSDVATVVQEIVGDEAKLHVVMPAGGDPHAFTVSADMIRSFEAAQLVVYAHSGFLHFEEHLHKRLAHLPTVDWIDYERHGAELKDLAGFNPNPHGFWLGYDNALAIARAVAERVPELGLDETQVTERLASFEKSLQLRRAEDIRLVRDAGLEGAAVVPVIPGIAYVVDNLGLALSQSLMAEGAGTVGGRTLDEISRQLREGKLAALVCPRSMREAKPGEVARQVAEDTQSQVFYVRFLDGEPGVETFAEIMKDNAAAITGDQAGISPAPPAPGTPATGDEYGILLLVAVFAVILIVLIVLVVARIARQAAAGSPENEGAGIFDDVDDEKKK